MAVSLNSLGTPMVSEQSLAMEERAIYVPDAERGVLACIMKDARMVIEADRELPVDSFFIEDNRYIFGIMIFIYRRCIERNWQYAFTPPAMAQMARTMGADYEARFYDRTNGLDKLRALQLIAQRVNLANFDQYVADVKDRAIRVHAYRSMRLSQLQLLDVQQNPNVGDVLNGTENWIGEAVCRTRQDDGQLRHLSDRDELMLTKARIAHDRPDLQLFYTAAKKMPRLMSILGGGLVRGGVTLGFARPKTGKSTWVMELLTDVAAQGIPVCLMDNEMGIEKTHSRELVVKTGWQERDLLCGKMYDDLASEQMIREAIAAIRHLPFYYVSVAGQSPAYIASQMRMFRDKYVMFETVKAGGKTYKITRPCLLAYDWFRVDEAAASGRYQEYQQIGYMMQAIRGAAKLLDVPVVAMAQHNRAATELTAEEWGTKSDNATGQSDRFNMFCDCRLDLRNLTPSELDWVKQKFGIQRGKSADHYELRDQPLFNQLIYVANNRNGANCSQGVPYYHDFGKFRYEELNDANAESHTKTKMDMRAVVSDMIRELSRKNRKNAAGGVSQLLQ